MASPATENRDQMYAPELGDISTRYGCSMSRAVPCRNSGSCFGFCLESIWSSYLKWLCLYGVFQPTINHLLLGWYGSRFKEQKQCSLISLFFAILWSIIWLPRNRERKIQCREEVVELCNIRMASWVIAAKGVKFDNTHDFIRCVRGVNDSKVLKQNFRDMTLF